MPWIRLPALRAAAKEFYEPLPSHASWPYVTYKFITDSRVGMWSRAKRTGRGARIDERVWGALARGEVDAPGGLGGSSGSELESEGESEEGRAYMSESDDGAGAGAGGAPGHKARIPAGKGSKHGKKSE